MVNEGKSAGVLRTFLPKDAFTSADNATSGASKARNKAATDESTFQETDADDKRAVDTSDRYKRIEAGQTEIVNGSLLSGLTSSGYLFPISRCPLRITIQIVSVPESIIETQAAQGLNRALGTLAYPKSLHGTAWKSRTLS